MMIGGPAALLPVSLAGVQTPLSVEKTGLPNGFRSADATRDSTSTSPFQSNPAGPVSASPKSGDEKAADGSSDSKSSRSVAGLSFSQAGLAMLRRLQARDREVRQHEAARQAVGGQYAGAVSYTYQRGPNGNAYAVGGEVPIDVSPVSGDPQATIEKMRTVRAAAMGPAEPSPQDLQVAAKASQIQIQAQAELAAEQGGADVQGQPLSTNPKAGPTAGGRGSPSMERSPVLLGAAAYVAIRRLEEGQIPGQGVSFQA